MRGREEMTRAGGWPSCHPQMIRIFVIYVLCFAFLTYMPTDVDAGRNAFQHNGVEATPSRLVDICSVPRDGNDDDGNETCSCGCRMVKHTKNDVARWISPPMGFVTSHLPHQRQPPVPHSQTTSAIANDTSRR
jgi:hypothetical protein